MILTVTPNPSLDLWLDVAHLRPGEFHRVTNIRRTAGGKGINVSRVIHALGGSTRILAAAGGPTGMEWKRLLKEEGVAASLVAISGETRINYKLRSGAAAQTTELNNPGPRLTRGEAKRFEGKLKKLSEKADCIVFSGSVPGGLSGGIYGDWIRISRAEGLPAVLDASGELLRRGLAAQPWLVKPNREEAQALLGRRIDSLPAARKAVCALCRRGAAMAVLSLASDGALWSARKSSQVWHAAAPRVRIISTVGSGDALLGGLLAGWQKGLSWPEALQFGVACASAAAQFPARCTIEETTRLLPRVRLKRLT